MPDRPALSLFVAESMALPGVAMAVSGSKGTSW